MIVKQIDLHKALELAGKGNEVLVMEPTSTDPAWNDYAPCTLKDMLEGCLFFRKEPAMENSDFADAVEAATIPVPPSEPDTPPTR